MSPLSIGSHQTSAVPTHNWQSILKRGMVIRAIGLLGLLCKRAIKKLGDMPLLVLTAEKTEQQIPVQREFLPEHETRYNLLNQNLCARERHMKTISYPTLIHNVREISILGTVDLEYWRAQLRPYALHPFNDNGHARFLITATSLKWNRIPACECVFAILLSRDENAANFDGSLLLHAVNSRRFFAWAERQAFATPYYPAAMDYEINPARFQVRVENQAVITAARRTNAAAQTTDETWEYPILLPPLDGSRKPPQKFFYAKLMGATQIAPFEAKDEFVLQDHARAPIFGQLRESNFKPIEWHIRADATHGKSNTFTVGKDISTAFDL